jgi:adenylate cyclase
MRTGARSASRPAASSFAKPPVRRLAAVLIADVAGYSRLMEQDETGTHLRLRDLRSELIEPAIEQHGGRIIRCAGDGLLVQFSSATDALRCAVEIQREMAQRNAQVPAAAQIRFRIGVNVADILFDDEDIAGSGVNLAARLETLAEPGGICISRALRDLIQEDLKVEYLDAGNRRVKNISRPVRVYRVLAEAPMPSALQRAAAGGLAGTLGRWIALASSAAVVAALAVTVSGRADLHPTLQEAAAAAVSLQRASRPRA